MRTVRYVLPLCMLFIIAGRVTDKLLVFEKGLLSRDEMKPLLGKYVCIEKTQTFTDGKTVKVVNDDKLILEQRGPRYIFSMESDGRDEGKESLMVISKIPDSRIRNALSGSKLGCFRSLGRSAKSVLWSGKRGLAPSMNKG